MTTARTPRTPRSRGPVADDTYVLENPEGYGSGLGHIPTGTEVTVIAVLAPGTAGVGHAGEESVLVSYEHVTHVLSGEGGHAPGSTPRAFSLHTSDFKRLFKKKVAA